MNTEIRERKNIQVRGFSLETITLKPSHWSPLLLHEPSNALASSSDFLLPQHLGRWLDCRCLAIKAKPPVPRLLAPPILSRRSRNPRMTARTLPPHVRVLFAHCRHVGIFWRKVDASRVGAAICSPRRHAIDKLLVVSRRLVNVLVRRQPPIPYAPRHPPPHLCFVQSNSLGTGQTKAMAATVGR